MPEQTALTPAYNGIPSHEDDSLPFLERVFLASKIFPTQVAIAQALDVSQPTISKYLKRLRPTNEVAKLLANNSAARVTRATIAGTIKAALDGRPEPGLELLDRLGVAEKRREDKTASVHVAVGINLAG